MTVKVSPKYQVVIPEKVRTSLGIIPGLHVDVIAKGGIAYIVPVPHWKDLQKEFQGKLTSKNLRDKSNREIER